jgi:hypothetical protein
MRKGSYDSGSDSSSAVAAGVDGIGDNALAGELAVAVEDDRAPRVAVGTLGAAVGGEHMDDAGERSAVRSLVAAGLGLQ